MTDLPRPARSGATPTPGILHFGPGAFFRAFGAVYTHDAMATAGGDWGIIAVSLQSPRARDQLAPQGGAYTSVTLTPEGREARTISSIVQVLVAPEDPEAVLSRLADPAIRIVTLTITEKGYCHAPATGALDLDHPDIQHDLAHPARPRTAPGFLVEGLARRRAAGLRPFTVLSCDNLPDNGAVAAGVVQALAAQRDPELAQWIGDHGAFPACMVDRITPATTADDVAALEQSHGVHDPAMVQHEGFAQWVIEDRFVDGARPAWDQVGAQFAADVAPFEALKLRCLNGSHSALAYLGYLAGHDSIAQTVADPVFAAFLDRFWRDDVLPTVTAPPGMDPASYSAALLRRYQNAAIHHRTWQIAMDGSQKLPQRLLAPLRAHRAKGRLPQGILSAIAAWLRYVSGRDEAGQAIDVRDPHATRLAQLHAGDPDADGLVARALGMVEVFGTDLAQDDAFAKALARTYSDLVAKGARGHLAG